MNTTTRRHPRSVTEAFPDPLSWWEGPTEPNEVIHESWNFRRTRRVHIKTVPSLFTRVLRMFWARAK